DTLDLLVGLAERFGERLRVRISGLVSYFLIPDFDERIAAHANIEFTGRYDWPVGLGEVYRAVDIVWAQELAWRGGNSDWLIPNRIYEASYFGVPSLAVRGTQTAQTIDERALGYVLTDAGVDTAAAFFETLSQETLASDRARLLERPDADFVLGDDDTTALLAAVRAQ
ncbi:MAG: glycosyl transferase, partial [Pseudomonadota bacterium]